MVFYNRKRKSAPTKPRPAKKAKGLSKVEKKQVSNMIKSKKEVYYIPTICYANNRALSTTWKQGYLPNVSVFQSTNLISASGLAVGNYLGSVGTNINTTSTILYPTGGIKLNADANNVVPIEGDKALMKSMKLNLRVSALKVESAAADGTAIKPLNFRCIVFKLKKARPAGIIPNFATGSTSAPSLFVDNLNQDVGVDDIQVPYEFENLRLNTQSVEVLRDIRFKLMNPLAFQTSSSIGLINNQHNIPTTKDLSFWLPCPKKPVQYDSARTPDNWDYRTYCIVFATRNGGTYTQTQGYWDMEASMISRVQEY